MPTRYVFVSFDVVGHSGQRELGVQRERILAINRIVRDVIAGVGVEGAVWASGGDGGHVAFARKEFTAAAVNLIIRLRRWSLDSDVALRVVASYGEAVEIEGADGRVQLVGHGINFAGRLLHFADEKNILVTDEFRDLVEPSNEVRFHDRSTIELPYFGMRSVYLLSIPGNFQSIPVAHPSGDDRVSLAVALSQENGALEALYRAKRLLQVNPTEAVAIDALQNLSRRQHLVPNSADMAALVLDRDFATDFIRSAELVERLKGEIVCRRGDHGTTMFLILRGALAGIPESGAEEFHLGPGEIVGEFAFALKRPRTATLWCLRDAALLTFEYDELVTSARNPTIRRQLEEAVNRTMRSRIAEHVTRTASYLAGKDGPLELSDATISKIRRFAKLVRCKWREQPVIRAADESVAAPGIYILVSGQLLQSETNRYLDGNDEPLVYVDLPPGLRWREYEYHLNDDVLLLAIEADAFLDFRPHEYQAIIARLEKKIGVQAAAARNKRRDRVFISYSHRDRAWLGHLKTHLEPLVGGGKLTVWDDTKIEKGEKWLDRIRMEIDSAKVAVLLVSPDFLASTFIRDQEFSPILRQAQDNGLLVLWIHVSHSLFEETALAQYQGAHDTSKPLDSLRRPDRNRVLVEICRAIGSAVLEP